MELALKVSHTFIPLELVDVLFLIDRDPNKIGKNKLLGHDVYSLEFLQQFKNKKITLIVAGKTSIPDMVAYAKSCGFNNILVYGDTGKQKKSRGETLFRELNQNRCIHLGKFLKTALGEQITLKKMPYMNGASDVLDYAFLLAVSKYYQRNTYLEVGTYIGSSIYNMAELGISCYGITAEENSPYSMADFCKFYNIPDFSNWLVKDKRIKMFFCKDSKEFDYSSITEKIDMYFIDADHSYGGVYTDTKNIFTIRDVDSIVVWHDFQQKYSYYDVVMAVKDVLGNNFKNVFITDSNDCGIYLPEKYQNNLPLIKRIYDNHPKELYCYNTTLDIDIIYNPRED